MLPLCQKSELRKQGRKQKEEKCSPNVLLCLFFFGITRLILYGQKNFGFAHGYSGHKYEHTTHVNSFYYSFAPVCLLQTGAICCFYRYFSDYRFSFFYPTQLQLRQGKRDLKRNLIKFFDFSLQSWPKRLIAERVVGERGKQTASRHEGR